ncbi:MAG TPA: hypothetical protein VFB72_04695 [Verrucomicrobiae bacterium]|nr:hypothetical protein [Verrucomicrobiae bacterium]
MQQGSIIVGSHVYFFRDGDAITVPGAGTSGRNSKAGAADPNWNDLGIIASVDVDAKSEDRTVYAPTPGRLRRYDVHTTKNDLDVDLDLEEMSPIVWEILFGTLPLTSVSTQYNPLASPSKKGWVKLQQYRGDNDASFNTVDIYCKLKIKSAVKMADDIIKTSLTCEVLHSIYNTGVLS